MDNAETIVLYGLVGLLVFICIGLLVTVFLRWWDVHGW
jgi:hypothetical protein